MKKIIIVVLFALLFAIPTKAQDDCSYWNKQYAYYHAQHMYYMWLWEYYTGGLGEWEYYWLYEIAQDFFILEGQVGDTMDRLGC